jgi:chemotaxis protein CheZ
MMRSVTPELRERLDNLKADGERQLSAAEVAEIIESVVTTLHGSFVQPAEIGGQSASSDTAAVKALSADANANAAEALTALNDFDKNGPAFANLSEEIDKIRAVTQDAADAILAVTEDIENLADEDDGAMQAAVFDVTNAIFEACNFQDITGQRLTRVEEMLRHIELSVTRAMAVLGDSDAIERTGELSDVVEQQDSRKEEHILHGPQDAGIANSQEEIDKILASFD